MTAIYDKIWNFWYVEKFYTASDGLIYKEGLREPGMTNLWLFVGWFAFFLFCTGIARTEDQKCGMICTAIFGGLIFSLLFPILLYALVFAAIGFGIYYIGVGSRNGFDGIRGFFNTEARLQKKLAEIQALLDKNDR